MSSGSFLEERDIPGASLCGRKPSELKNVELKFWLRCRDDPGKGLKTTAELVKRYDIDRSIFVILQVTLKIFSMLIFIRFLYQDRRVRQDWERQKYRGSWSKWSLHQAKTTTHRNRSCIECYGWWCTQQRTPYCQVSHWWMEYVSGKDAYVH